LARRGKLQNFGIYHNFFTNQFPFGSSVFILFPFQLLPPRDGNHT
jgi:hypothetical protein